MTEQDFSSLFIMAERYFLQGQLEDAQTTLLIILESNNFHARANELLGYVYGRKNDVEKAYLYLERSTKNEECSFSAFFELSILCHQMGNIEKAERYLNTALNLGHKNSSSYQFGLLYSQREIWDLALIAFKKTLAIDKNSSDTLFNIGLIYDQKASFEQAATYYQEALNSNKGYVPALINLALILKNRGQLDQAFQLLDRATNENSSNAEAWFNKGSLLYDLCRYEESLIASEKAIELAPEYAAAWHGKGLVLNELERYDEAILCYDQALNLEPNVNWLYGELIHLKMKVSSWGGIQEGVQNLKNKVMVNHKISLPFPLLSLSDDANFLKKSSEIYSKDKYPLNLTLGPIPKRSKNKKIRVGYFSADFKNHAVSILTAELFELHDKSKFEIIAFSFGDDDKSPMRLRLCKAFNQFIDVGSMTDEAVARLARELSIDIAVDFGGFTKNGRTGIFACRAAPVQVSYIGYLGTMGAQYFDYLVADKTIVPDGSENFYSEKIVYLQSYQANDRKRKISDRKFTRHELGLPEKGFVFCSFNSNYKILPATFDGWMRILKEVEGSVLFLYADNKWAAANLKREAEDRGRGNGARLVFGKRIAADEYLARYRVCDLFLDTFPYNAGTTASDALWVGLPVLTLAGESFASRMASSLLKAAGLPELITNTQEEYEALAIELATDSYKLNVIKRRLSKNHINAPIFDTPLFTKNLEVAYIKMYDKYQADLPPEHIYI